MVQDKQEKQGDSMINWESLIADRMRPAKTVIAVTYRQAIRRAKDRRYYKAHKDDPEFKRKKSERMKRVRNTDEYRERHRLEMRRRRAEKKQEKPNDN